MSPAFGQQGQSRTVNITGLNTNFSSGSVVNFGPGITINSIAVGGPTSLTVGLSIAPDATPGPRDVIVTTGGASVTGSGMFTVNAAPSSISSVVPGSGQQAQTLDVIVSAINTGFNGTTTVNFGSGITVNSQTVNSATSLSANVTVAPDAVVGPRDVIVTTNGLPLTGAGMFQVVARPPVQISSISPSSGQQGQMSAIAITGLNTHFSPTSTVSFGPGIIVDSVSYVSPTNIVANIRIASNAAPGLRDVSVTTGAESVVGTGLFTVTSAPSLLSASPNSAQRNQTLPVTITGLNTNFNNTSTLSFAGGGIVVNSININSATSLTANITIAEEALLGARDVTVTTNGAGVTGTALFTVLPSEPQTITAVTPSTGRQGQTLPVTITSSGTNFNSGSTVSFGSGITVVDVTANSPTSITANITISPGAVPGPRNVTVTTAGTPLTGVGLFSVVPRTPRIMSLSPNVVTQGQTATLMLNGEFTSFQQGVTQISLGERITVNSVTVVSPTTLSVDITVAPDAPSGARTLMAKTGEEQLSAGLTVLAPSGQFGPFTCQTNAGVPPLLRAEGFTELVGDIVIVCTGGNPGEASAVNLQLFLNTPITSRIVSGKSEALLIVEAPEGVGGPVEPDADLVEGARRFYRAVRAEQGQNSIVWTNVRVPAPGPDGQTVLRIVNVRANAAAIGASTSLIPANVVAFVSVSPSQSLPLRFAQIVVGYVQPGLNFAVTNCNNTANASGSFVQCVGENSSGDHNLLSGTRGAMQFALRFTEGFQTAFKTRLFPGQTESIPGVVYHSESGFLRTPALPYAVGGADSGTRLSARFTNIPAGVRLFATTSPSAGSTAGLTATLVQAGVSGGGSTGLGSPVAVAPTATLFCPITPASGFSAVEIPVVNGTALAVWEVIGTDASILETAVFGIAVAHVPDAPNRLPGVGQTEVLGSFAPFYAAGSDAGQTSSSLLIPRFLDGPTRHVAFYIGPCVTNLLFPFVTNQAGFDTGIAISNTSRDPFETQGHPQSGSCTIHYYGSTPTGPAPPPQTSSVVDAGSVMSFVVSSGGSHGIAPTPGFQGYLMAQCNFQYAHGFAFLTDGPIGIARVAEGYLGLVLDGGGAMRGSLSESLGK